MGDKTRSVTESDHRAAEALERICGGMVDELAEIFDAHTQSALSKALDVLAEISDRDLRDHEGILQMVNWMQAKARECLRKNGRQV